MEKGVVRNFTQFTGKHLCQSLRLATLLNKRLWHRYFTVNFAKFLRIPFLQNTSGQLLVNLPETLIFRSSCSQMFFKVSILKNFTVLEPLSNNKLSFTEHLRWLLLNFCGSKYFFAAEYGIYC